MKYYLRIIDTKPNYIEVDKSSSIIEGIMICKFSATAFPYAIIDIHTGLPIKRFAFLKTARQYLYTNLQEILIKVSNIRKSNLYKEREEDLLVWRKNHE